MEKDLNELVVKLRSAAGGNLKSVVLYGSAATDDFHPGHSDLNVLCVLERLDADALAKLNPPATWWEKKGHPAPLMFTLEELRRSADVFAIELLDIKSSRRVLSGEDPFATLEVPMTLHRVQLEHELRAKLVRLRQRYLATAHDRKRLLGLMSASISTFLVLFRHALIVLGEQPPKAKRDVLSRLSSLLGFEPQPFLVLLDVREGQRKEKDVDVEKTFRGYFDAITRVVEEVDRRLVGGGSAA